MTDRTRELERALVSEWLFNHEEHCSNGDEQDHYTRWQAGEWVAEEGHRFSEYEGSTKPACWWLPPDVLRGVPFEWR